MPIPIYRNCASIYSLSSKNDWPSDLQLMKWRPADRAASQIGVWSSETGVILTDEDSYNVFQSGRPRLMVVTIEEPPYVMLSCANCSGNQRYEGFAIDLLNSISKVGRHLLYRSDQWL